MFPGVLAEVLFTVLLSGSIKRKREIAGRQPIRFRCVREVRSEVLVGEALAGEALVEEALAEALVEEALVEALVEEAPVEEALAEALVKV